MSNMVFHICVHCIKTFAIVSTTLYYEKVILLKLRTMYIYIIIFFNENVSVKIQYCFDCGPQFVMVVLDTPNGRGADP